MENGEKGRMPSLDDVMRAVLPEDMPMHPDHPMQQAEPAPAQDELLPCPFCGGEPNLTHGDYVRDDLSPMPVVECKSCSAWVRAEDWNRRPAQTEQQPVVMPAYRTTPDQSTFKLKEDWQNRSMIDAGFNTALDEVARLNAAPIAQTAPQPEQSGLYTCIGKGGSYELIGRATTAGALKVTGRFADEVIVYRDTKSNALYCREPGDFRLRMARAALSTQGGSDE